MVDLGAEVLPAHGANLVLWLVDADDELQTARQVVGPDGVLAFLVARLDPFEGFGVDDHLVRDVGETTRAPAAGEADADPPGVAARAGWQLQPRRLG